MELFYNNNKLPQCATTWIKLTSIMLNERSRTQKTTYCVIPLKQNSSMVLKVRTVVTPGWGGYVWDTRGVSGCWQCCFLL